MTQKKEKKLRRFSYESSEYTIAGITNICPKIIMPLFVLRDLYIIWYAKL